MDWSEIIHELQKTPSNTVQFIAHVESERDIGPAIVALANGKGGKIFVGIDNKNYHLTGFDFDETWVQHLVKNYCSPEIEFQIFSIFKNDKKIQKIQVFEGRRKPYIFQKKCYIRTDNNTHIASLAEETEIKDSNPEVEVEIIEHTVVEGLPKNENVEEKIDKKIDPVSESLNERQRKALEYLQNNKSIRNKEFRQFFKVSHKTAHLELVDLVNKGFISSTGSGRSTCYVMNKYSTKQISLL